MSREEEAKNTRLFDVRAVERNIRKGLITRKDYEKHLKSLPDVTDKIAPKEAPVAPANRPTEYVPPPIVATMPPPSAAGADDDLDDLDDEDLDDLDDDEEDLDEEPNGARKTGEEPPSS